MKFAVLALSILTSTIVVTPVVAAQNLSLPAFRDIGVSGSAVVNVTRGPTHQVIIREGSAAISRIRVKHGDSLEIRTCFDHCPDNYRLVVDVVTPDVGDLAVSGSSRMVIASTFDRRADRDMAVSGSGVLDASRVSSGNVSAAVSGSGRLQVGHAARIDAAVSGSGRITYDGNPYVAKVVAGSGSVEPER